MSEQQQYSFPQQQQQSSPQQQYQQQQQQYPPPPSQYSQQQRQQYSFPQLQQPYRSPTPLQQQQYYYTDENGSGRNTSINDEYPPQKFSNDQKSAQGVRAALDDDYEQKLASGRSESPIADPGGWQYRPPHYGHIITKGEIINRIVSYYEMFIVNAFLLGYKVLENAHQAVVGSTYRIILFDACTDRWRIEDFDFCAASRLIIGLIFGAIIYFIITGLVAIGIAIELRRKGFHSSFTALWNSPLFLFCFFFPENKRVDILTVPNKYVNLALWTRAHIQRIAMAVYAFVCVVLVLHSLTKGVAETSRIRGEKGLSDGIKKYYNSHLVPYYVTLYIFFKTLTTMLIEIFQDKEIRNRPELIGRYYQAIKADNN
ncbi:2502_t:CDS:2 [Ambispora gerdemannii]|uniref:2502_t:CDS:1 n=1 Tax=Ambispora gerdemannii TaxID=144530 RepID=A0A9N9F1J1_9GLOM|nr:2502_t:CDS:2 [Ambispora gerdemannii]